jgi:two-component system, NtrC family, response regulator GlrR
MTRVLLVENEVRALRVMDKVLSRHGYEVRIATNAQDAVTIGQTFTPHVLLTDWLLEDEHDGLYVAATLRTLDPHLALVLFSGFAIDALQQAASHLGPCVFLEKPFGIHALESALTCALQHVTPS